MNEVAPSPTRRPRKRFGQHFLIRPDIVQRILALADLREADTVLEIGPGRGALTRDLRQRCARLLLIEIDRDLAAELRDRFAGDAAVRIIEGDVLKIDIAAELAGESPATVVANLPYNISTPLLARLLRTPEIYRRMVLMLQREVADRLCAAPGGKDYGALSVAVQLAARARVAFRVPPTAFHPQPKVESAVVVIEPLEHQPLDRTARDAVRGVTRALFNHRRKQLGNLMRQLSEHGGEILADLDIDPRRRPETLTPDDFVALTRALQEADR